MERLNWLLTPLDGACSIFYPSGFSLSAGLWIWPCASHRGTEFWLPFPEERNLGSQRKCHPQGASLRHRGQYQWHNLHNVILTVSLRHKALRYFFFFFFLPTVTKNSKIQFSSVAQSCLTLCGPMDCIMPGLPVHHQLPEFTQAHVHWVGDAIQPSHPPVVPLSSCLRSFPASESFPMSQFFTTSGRNFGASASTPVLPMNIQDWFPLGWTGWTFLLSKGLSRVFSNTTVQKHQFFRAQLFL